MSHAHAGINRKNTFYINLDLVIKTLAFQARLYHILQRWRIGSKSERRSGSVL